MCNMCFFIMSCMFIIFLSIIKTGDNMFYKHLIINNEEEDSLYLFVDFNYEFSADFNLKGHREKIKTLQEKIINYIKDKKINFNMGKVFLVVGGLVIGSLFIQNYQYSDLTDSLEPKYTYVEHIDIFKDNELEDDILHPSQENNTTSEIKDVNIEQKKPVVEKSIQTKIHEITPKSTATPTTIVPPAVKTPTAIPKIEPKEVAPPAQQEKTVTLYRYNGTVEQIGLEEYIVGVVSAEMPASFNSEALKAQSVVARTYALKKINNNLVLKDDTSNQVYKDVGQLKILWGNNFDTYYNKVKKAVDETKGQYLAYNGDYIEAVYHSTSNGQTEDSVTVWGNNYPYLKSVDSHWDLEASSYLRETEKEFSVLSSIIGLDFNVSTNVEVLSKTSSNRIDKIKIDDTVFSGIELRALLGLRSTDFDIKIEENKAIFVTRGYGHGVGMSQYGANGMAKEGYVYNRILSHYYPGTQIKK